jgi:tryptophan-rich sensory protein
MKIKIWILALCIIIALLPGIIGSLFTSATVQSDWYENNKPSITPPNYLFGPVWTILYILIGISLYLAFYLFAANLILNALWSIFFFSMQNPVLALIDIILLWFSILALIIYNYKISHTSSYLLIPYLLWVTFATALNIGFIV